MKTIQRNGVNYFPNGTKNVWLLLFDYYFQPLHSEHIYKLTAKDFETSKVTGTNIEDPKDKITLDFKTPVTQFKKF